MLCINTNFPVRRHHHFSSYNFHVLFSSSSWLKNIHHSSTLMKVGCYRVKKEKPYKIRVYLRTPWHWTLKIIIIRTVCCRMVMKNKYVIILAMAFSTYRLTIKSVLLDTRPSYEERDGKKTFSFFRTFDLFAQIWITDDFRLERSESEQSKFRRFTHFFLRHQFVITQFSHVRMRR